MNNKHHMSSLENCTKNYSFESIWDIEDNVEDDNNEFIINKIKQFIKDNYDLVDINRCEFVFDEKKNKYIISCNHQAILKHNSKQLTNDLFEWGTVKGYFDCSGCSITTLKGAPKEVGGNFYCSNCPKLTTLKGAPKEVGGDFYCTNCPTLKSLEGVPTHMKGKIFSDEDENTV